MTHTPLKIRASSAGKLMTEPKLVGDKKEGNLSEGAKTYIRELWIEKTYRRRKDITNKYVEKGLLNEELAIDDWSMYNNEMYVKNEKLFTNDFILGTPDLITDFVDDIKNAWDIFTFMEAELTTLNYWQMQCYLELTEKKQGRVVYCLTNAPEATIQRELKSAAYKLQVPVDGLPELEEKLRKEMNYDDIPLKDRIKIFPVEYNPDDIQKLYDKITKARIYFNSLTL